MNLSRLSTSSCWPAADTARRFFLALYFLWLGLASLPSPVGANPADGQWMSFAAPGVDWEAVQEMSLSAVPVRVRPFSSQRAPVEVASALALHGEFFQRILTAPGAIVLSGVQDDWHWLAQVNATNPGTRGFVSALKFDKSAPALGDGLSDPHLRWLPPQSSPQFGHRTDTKDGPVDQSIYIVGASPDAVMGYVRRSLRAEGWLPEPLLANRDSYGAWRRENAKLTLLARASGQSSVLYVQHLP